MRPDDSGMQECQSKMGPDIGFLSWQSPRPVSVTHTEILITFLGLCVHKLELAIWVLNQVPGYFNEVPCLGVQLLLIPLRSVAAEKKIIILKRRRDSDTV